MATQNLSVEVAKHYLLKAGQTRAQAAQVPPAIIGRPIGDVSKANYREIKNGALRGRNLERAI